MLKPLYSLGCSLLLLGSVFIGGPVSARNDIVVCQSVRGRIQRCAMDTRGEVRLIRQLSQASCRGRWSYGRGFVEVRDGCRAEFASYSRRRDNRRYDYDRYDNRRSRGRNSNRTICSSSRGRIQRCPFTAVRGRVRLVRELSRGSCAGNWTYRNGYILVRNGCRGEFESWW